LRERKKRRTRRAIQEIALDLFEKQGFDATTVEQIAAAAEISPSTFFNYFPSKEDAVAFDEYDPILFEVLRSRPPDEPPIEKVRYMMLHAAVPLMEQDRDLVLQRTRIAFGEPELRARLWQETDEGLEQLAQALAGPDHDPDDFELRVAVRVIESVAFEAMLEWARRDGKPNLRRLVERAFDFAAAGLREVRAD
jgi:AcrR family transcriptional regulator